MRNVPVVGNVKELFAVSSQRDLGGSGRELPTEIIVFVVVVVVEMFLWWRDFGMLMLRGRRPIDIAGHGDVTGLRGNGLG